jgi:hypothetical protein
VIAAPNSILTSRVIVPPPEVQFVVEEQEHQKKYHCAKQRGVFNSFMHWFFGEQDLEEVEHQYHDQFHKKDLSHIQSYKTRQVHPVVV